MDAPVVDTTNNQVGTVALNENIFGAQVNEGLLWEVVRMQAANARQGTHAVKGRSDVSGGGIKPFRQKGTGRARMGSRRSPLHKGGAIIFGPVPRSYAYSMPKKKRRIALMNALSAKFRDGEVIVLEKFGLGEIKTKALASTLEKLGAASALIVVAGRDEIIEKSARNLATAKAIRPEGLNVYDMLRYDKVILVKDALVKIEERLLLCPEANTTS